MKIKIVGMSEGKHLTIKEKIEIYRIKKALKKILISKTKTGDLIWYKKEKKLVEVKEDTCR